MPRGDKSAYTDKQKRKAEHIEEGYEKRGVSKKEAERRAWATVNRETGGGNKSGSGRGVQDTKVSSKRGGRIGGKRRGAPLCSCEIALGEEGRRNAQATGRATLGGRHRPTHPNPHGEEHRAAMRLEPRGRGASTRKHRGHILRDATLRSSSYGRVATSCRESR